MSLSTILRNSYSIVQKHLETDSAMSSLGRIGGELVRLGSSLADRDVSLIGLSYLMMGNLTGPLINSEMQERVPKILVGKGETLKFSEPERQIFAQSTVSSLASRASQVDYERVIVYSTGEISVDGMLETFGFSASRLKGGGISQMDLAVVISFLDAGLTESWKTIDKELKETVKSHYAEVMRTLNIETADKEKVKILRERVDDIAWGLHRRAYKIE